MALPADWAPGTWWPLVVVTIALVAAATAGGYLLGRTTEARRRSAPMEPVPPPAAASTALDPRVRGLVVGLIGAHDLAATHDAVRSHVEQVLRRSGVHQVLAASGEEFDPDHQEAVATESSASVSDRTAAAGRVARTVRPGWQDDSLVYRAAEVVVWTE